MTAPAPVHVPAPESSRLRWGRGITTGAIAVGVVFGASVGLGFGAKSLQDPVDTPIFDRIDEAGTNSWTDVLSTLTKMGNTGQTQVLAGVLAVLLALWFWRRGWRWWMPLFVLPATWGITRGCQLVMAKVVDREREVISLLGTEIGAWPSGGVVRIVAVSGAAVVLAVYYGGWTGRLRTVALLVPVVLGIAELYFRLRLNQHWATDVVGGLVVGLMFVAAIDRTLRAFDPSPGPVVRD